VVIVAAAKVVDRYRLLSSRDNNHFDLDISGKFRVFNSQSKDENKLQSKVEM